MPERQGSRSRRCRPASCRAAGRASCAVAPRSLPASTGTFFPARSFAFVSPRFSFSSRPSAVASVFRRSRRSIFFSCAACSLVGNFSSSCRPTALLFHVGEEGGELVELLRRERIELVIVAFGSSRASGRARPSRRCARGRRHTWPGTPSPARRPPPSSSAGGCSPRRSASRRVGFGSRSPASCSMVKLSNGLFLLKASMT